MSVDKLLEGASLGKAVAIVAVLLACAVGMAAYEQRTTLFLAITGSWLGLGATVSAVALVLVSSVAWLFVTTLDKRTQVYVTDLQRQITELRAQYERDIAHERTECERRLKEAREYCDQQIQLALRR